MTGGFKQQLKEMEEEREALDRIHKENLRLERAKQEREKEELLKLEKESELDLYPQKQLAQKKKEWESVNKVEQKRPKR